MKRQKFAPRAALALCGVICTATYISCGMEIPESVAVRTDAEFGVPLGDTEFKIADKVSADKMTDALGGDGGFGVYEFNPGGSEDSVIEFVIDYPVQNSNLSDSTGGNLGTKLDALAAAGGSYPKTVSLSTYTDFVETGLNFTDMLKSFGSDDDDDGGGTDYSYIFDKVNLRGIRAYAYITGDECFSFSGRMYVTPNENASGEKKDSGEYVLSSDSSKRLVADSSAQPDGKFHVKAAPDLGALSAAGADGVITDGSFLASGRYTTELAGNVVEDMLNDKDNKKFTLVYDLTPTLTINSAEDLARLRAAAAAGGVSYSVNLVIRLPLMLDVTDDVTIDDVLDLAGHALDEDLFGRDGADDDKISKFADLLDSGSMTISYKFSDTTGLSFGARIVAKDERGERFVNEAVEFQGGRRLSEAEEMKVELTAEEAQRIFRSYPFQPKIELVVRKTTSPISLRRNSTFGTWATFCLKTGGQYTVWEK